LNTTSQAVSCFAYSDGSINLTVQGGVTPYNFAWNGGLPAIEDPTDVSAGSYTVVVTDANGCTAAATQVVTQPDGMTLDVVLSAFGNFNVSCYNSEDGTAEVNVTGGVSPYMFLWSNGSANALTRNLAPNTDYTVTVTDANGCTLAETVNLTAPAPISADVSTASTSCEGDNDGRITIESVIGGIGDYVYSFAGRPFTPVGQQGFLPAGDYPVIVQDAAGCEWDTVVTVGEPAELVVDLGGDQLITLGESAFIDPLTSAIVDTTIWILPDSFDCPPSEWPCEVTPYFTTRYMIRVIDEKGCVAEDEILIRVEKPREIFVPNAFSPNDDGFNDYIKLYGGRDIEVVKQFLIFNRWGEKVYELRDFHPNSYPDSDGWNGTFLGKRLDPAVFVYFAEVTFIDGETVVFEGDITLIR
jgi:gliding motility-associated-like protein